MPRILLAPMEGLVDAVMRHALTQASAYAWCVTEFVRVSSSVLPAKVYTRVAPELLNASCTGAGTPVRVQLLGSDPGRMGACADVLAGLQPAGVDLNFGCPAPMVNRHGGGAILLDEPEQLLRIVAQVRQALDGRVPLTAKMRLGVRDTSRAIEAAQALEAGGAELLVVHARTKEDGYRPPAHWAWIARIAEAVKVPVIANGEIWTAADYRRCVAESGMRDVMLGRGAVADPFLAERIRLDQSGASPRELAEDWRCLQPVLAEFWQGVQRKLEPHQAPGRIKQWLNFLRRTYPQAEILYQGIRPLREAAQVSAALLAAGVH